MEIDLEYLERLSKLEIAEEKKQQFKNDFLNTLNFVDEITKIELPEMKRSECVPISSLREDVVKKNEDFDALQNAPEKKDGYFQVPLVVE